MHYFLHYSHTGKIIQDISSTLRKRYENNRFTVKVYEWPPDQPKHYTSLSFIDCKEDHKDENFALEFIKKGNTVCTLKLKSKQKYGVQNTVYTNTTNNISDLFAPIIHSNGDMSNPKSILIEGAPGMGKSTLSKEIAYQWAKGDLLKSKKFVFLVHLRELHLSDVNSTENFLQRILYSSNHQKCEQIAQHIGDPGKDIAIILDDCNEINKSFFISELLKRNVWSDCMLIVTTCHDNLLPLRGTVDRRIKIMGFTAEDRLKYIDKAFKDSHERIIELKKFLKNNPVINALCYVPLNMTILQSLAKRDIRNLPETQTKLYERIIETTIRHHLQQNEGSTVSFRGLFDLPDSYKENFWQLACLAFQMLQNNKLDITSHEMQNMYSKSPVNYISNDLGLVSCVKTFDGKESDIFHFLHFSIQEYMAAYYISKLEDSEQLKLLQTTFFEVHYYNTWIMYTGITGGKGTALEKFLFESKFSLPAILTFSKPLKPAISPKFLGDKLKCLHIFQCFAETKNESLMSLVGTQFTDQIIDLSCTKALSPEGIRTLNFFLLRSRNKKWKKLNLSKCNLKIDECKTLSELLFDDNLVHINCIDLSYNSLKLLSFVGLFHLLKSWHTSQIIIADKEDNDNATVQGRTADKSNLFVTSENAFFETDITVILFGTYFFAYNINYKQLCEVQSEIQSDTFRVNSMYLLNCEVLIKGDFLLKHRLTKIHILNTEISNCIDIISNLLCIRNKITVLFIYDSVLSDQIADEKIGRLILKDTYTGIRLLISETKVQGTINTCSLRSELSNLEMFNLFVRLRSLHTCNIPCWSNTLHFCCYDSETLLWYITSIIFNIDSYQLRIKLIEGNTLIAQKVSYETITNKDTSCNENAICNKPFDQSFRNIFLSGCNLRNSEYEDIITSFCGEVCSLHILHSHLESKILCEILENKSFTLKELFLHTDRSIANPNLDNPLYQNVSVVFVSKKIIAVHNPTNMQLARAFQLEPSITECKFVNCKLCASTFYFFLYILTKSSIEVDFTGCTCGSVECKVISEYFNRSKLQIIKLKFSATKDTYTYSQATASEFIKLIFITKIKEIIISNSITSSVYYKLMEKLVIPMINHSRYASEVCLSLAYRNMKVKFYCCVDWSVITKSLDNTVTGLFMINCQLSNLSGNNLTTCLSKLPSLSQVCFINCSLQNTVISSTLEDFRNKNYEMFIFNTCSINVENLYNLVSDQNTLQKTKLHFVAMVDDLLCIHNVTQHQLDLLKFMKWSFSDTEKKVLAMVNKAIIKMQKCLFMFHRHQLIAFRFTAKDDAALDAALIVSAIDSAFLRIFGIDNCHIKVEDISRIKFILNQNPGLEELYLNNTFYNKDAFLAVIRVLKRTSTLKHFGIVGNQITCELLDEILPILHNNLKLKGLNIGHNNLKDASIAKLASALSWNNNLQQLGLECINITDKAIENIAAIISRNTNLQALNLSNNGLQSASIIKIVESLQYTSTLEQLELHNNNATEKAAKYIGDVLKHSANLQVLDLGGNNLQAQGIERIANGLQSICTLKQLQICNNNINSDAADNIADIVSNNTDLQVLDISGNNLLAAGITKIAKKLKNIATLSELHLSINKIGAGAADDIAAVLSQNTKLQLLYLNDNHFQATGIKILLQGFKQTYNIRALQLQNITISEEASDDIAAALLCCNRLEVLNLSRNNLQPKGIRKIADVLQNFSTLQQLKLCNNNITAEAASDIANVLAHNTNLVVLHLNGNDLQSIGVKLIAKPLKSFSTLGELNLAGNNVTEEAADDIATVLLHNANIQVLDLSKNNLKATGVIKIAKVLKAVETLRALYLSYNNLSKETATDIADILVHNTNLQVLNLNGNRFQATGVIAIANGLKNSVSLNQLEFYNSNATIEAASDIASVLSHNTNLQVLNLGKNDLQSKGFKIVAETLQGISTLVELHLAENNINEEEADDIKAVLLHSLKLKVLNLNRNNLQSTGVIKVMKGLKNTLTLKELSLSNNNITEGAANDLATVLSHNTNLSVLNLNGNDLRSTGISIIFKDLWNNTELCELHISNNNITEEAADDIAYVLSHNTNLTVLNLDGNKLQSKGIVKIVHGLESTNSLCKLGLKDNNVKDALGIGNVLTHNKCICELNLNGNNLKAQGVITIANKLSNACSILQLELGNNNTTKMTEEKTRPIATVLSHNINLLVLDLEGWKFDMNATINIVNNLKGTHNLEILRLGYCNVSEQAADHIQDILLQNTKLKVLNLAGNNLQVKGTIKVAKGLQDCSSLQHLELNSNNITKEAACDIAAILLHNIKLQVLNLNKNNLHAAGVIEIAKSLNNAFFLQQLKLENNNATEEAAYDIAAVLSHSNNLRVLNINGNNLQLSGIRKIAASLQEISSLTELHVCNNNITAEAAVDIAKVLLHNKNLQILDLSGNNLQSAGIKTLATALQNISVLREIYLNDNSITEEAADDIAAFLLHNTRLQVFSIKENHLAKGINKIAMSLKNIYRLQKLQLGSNNITEEASHSIAAISLNCPDLSVLELDGNDLQSTGIKTIAKGFQKNTLCELDLSKNNISAEAAEQVAAILMNNPNLQVLNLNNNNLQTKGIAKIAKGLKNTFTLLQLHLSNVKCTQQVVPDIASVLKHNNSLKVLDLSNNNLQAYGVKDIAEGLKQVDTLNKLNLSDNNITDKGANDIGRILSRNTNLHFLHLTNNKLKRDGIEIIAERLVNTNTDSLLNIGLGENSATTTAADAIARFLSYNRNLEIIDLAGNDLKADGIIKIMEKLQHIKSLRTLNLSNNNATVKAAYSIATVLSQNSKSLQKLYLGKNNLRAGVTNIVKQLQNVCTLEELQLNHNNITAEAADDIAAALSHKANLTVINLNGNQLQMKGILTICQCLQTINTLKQLHLSDNKATESAARNIECVLSCNSNLQELDLSGNSLQANGVIKIALGLRKISRLQTLRLADNNATTADAAESIKDVLLLNTKLKILDLGKNNMQEESIKKVISALRQTVALEELHLNHNNITEEAVDDIAVILSHNVNMKVLNLNGNNLKTKGVKKLFQSTSSLTELHLDSNNITGEAANDIAVALSVGNKLQKLTLRENYLEEEGKVHILNAAQNTLEVFFDPQNTPLSPLNYLYIHR